MVVNKFSLRRYGITNQNTFRCSGRADETAKRGRNCTCHYSSAFKATKLDEDSTVLKSIQSDLFDAMRQEIMLLPSYNWVRWNFWKFKMAKVIFFDTIV